MNKNFDKWNNLKKEIQLHREPPLFREYEVWWCSLGVNIGFEEDGKNEMFERPVLIFRKFNKNIFWGLPLTSKEKENKFYFTFEFNNRRSSVILSQLRVFSGKRLIRRMGRVNRKTFDEIESKVLTLTKETGPLRGPRVPFGNL